MFDSNTCSRSSFYFLTLFLLPHHLLSDIIAALGQGPLFGHYNHYGWRPNDWMSNDGLIQGLGFREDKSPFTVVVLLHFVKILQFFNLSNSKKPYFNSPNLKMPIFIVFKKPIQTKNSKNAYESRNFLGFKLFFWYKVFTRNLLISLKFWFFLPKFLINSFWFLRDFFWFFSVLRHLIY